MEQISKNHVRLRLLIKLMRGLLKLLELEVQVNNHMFQVAQEAFQKFGERSIFLTHNIARPIFKDLFICLA